MRLAAQEPTPGLTSGDSLISSISTLSLGVIRLPEAGSLFFFLPRIRRIERIHVLRRTATSPGKNGLFLFIALERMLTF